MNIGADFIFWRVAMPQDKPPDWEKARQYIEAEVWHTTKDTWAQLQEDFAYEDPQESKEDLLADLEILKQAWEGHDREAGIMTFLGHRILITGGMTWGDDPTGLYTSMVRLWNTQALELAGFV